MSPPILVYTPTRRGLWLRVLVRELLFPQTRWARLLVGPELITLGLVGILLASLWDSSALGLVSGALVGIGLAWASWPLAGAWLAVTRNGAVRRRGPVRLVLTSGAVELVRGDDRRLFPLEDLERIETIGGEHWLRFRGERALMIPTRVSEGDANAFVAAIRGYRSTIDAAQAIPEQEAAK
ncbi:MAG: hypothetical protein ABMB14_33090 [Myxococcota bacterium]